MRTLRTMTLAALALSTASCSEQSTALVLNVRSSLIIPDEANVLVVRITDAGAILEEESYSLDEAPRNVWPQKIPIVAGQNHSKTVGLAVELRLALPNSPSVLTGFSETTATFPSSGQSEVDLEVARACVDEDMDGFGAGFGCEKPDCDDTRPDIPVPNFCAEPPRPDGGVSDGGPNTPDAGQPPTCEMDGQICAPGRVCFMRQCLKSCTAQRDCGAIELACLEIYGVCICRVPCFDGNECGPYQCVDGCCRI